MAEITVNVKNGQSNVTIVCDQADIRFEHQLNGDGILVFPDGNGYIKIVINKENIS